MRWFFIMAIFGVAVLYAQAAPPAPPISSTSGHGVPKRGKVGKPVAYRFSGGATNIVEVKTRSATEYPGPLFVVRRGPRGHFRKPPAPPKDTRPYYETKVWNELTKSYIEHRIYMPGNTSFFQSQLVIP